MTQKNVQAFYDGPGWEMVGMNTVDAVANENLTETALEYVSKVRNRISQKVGMGRALLDIGSGPIQYPEYVNYSQNFETRVCVDLSAKALMGAQKKIGSHGKFIVGDYLDIPTPEIAPFDGATLINVLYHVKKERQEELVRKILNDLSPGKCLVVVYSNPRAFSSILTKAVVVIKHLFQSRLNRERFKELSNPIYFYRFNIKFWQLFKDDARVTIYPWRTFTPALEKILFKKYMGGKFLLKLLFEVEKFRWWRIFAEYQLIVLRKH